MHRFCYRYKSCKRAGDGKSILVSSLHSVYGCVQPGSGRADKTGQQVCILASGRIGITAGSYRCADLQLAIESRTGKDAIWRATGRFMVSATIYI